MYCMNPDHPQVLSNWISGKKEFVNWPTSGSCLNIRVWASGNIWEISQPLQEARQGNRRMLRLLTDAGASRWQ